MNTKPQTKEEMLKRHGIKIVKHEAADGTVTFAFKNSNDLRSVISRVKLFVTMFFKAFPGTYKEGEYNPTSFTFND